MFLSIFDDFDKTPSDYYQLNKLSLQYLFWQKWIHKKMIYLKNL